MIKIFAACAEDIVQFSATTACSSPLPVILVPGDLMSSCGHCGHLNALGAHSPLAGTHTLTQMKINPFKMCRYSISLVSLGLTEILKKISYWFLTRTHTCVHVQSHGFGCV